MPNFAATWILGFIIYCWWQSLVLYLTILSQNVLLYSPLQTAIRFIRSFSPSLLYPSSPSTSLL